MNIYAFTIYPDVEGAALLARLSHYYTSSRSLKKGIKDDLRKY